MSQSYNYMHRRLDHNFSLNPICLLSAQHQQISNESWDFSARVLLKVGEAETSIARRHPQLPGHIWAYMGIYGKLTFGFCQRQQPRMFQKSSAAVVTCCAQHIFVATLKLLFWCFGDREENWKWRRRSFDKSWNVNYSFQLCRKYQPGETDFIRVEV